MRSFADELEVARWMRIPPWKRIATRTEMEERGLIPRSCRKCQHALQPSDRWCRSCGRTR